MPSPPMAPLAPPCLSPSSRGTDPCQPGGHTSDTTLHPQHTHWEQPQRRRAHLWDDLVPGQVSTRQDADRGVPYSPLPHTDPSLLFRQIPQAAASMKEGKWDRKKVGGR